MKKQTLGTITGVKTLWFVKVNTKPVRQHGLDGAIFPYLVTITYNACGQDYKATKIIKPTAAAPVKGEKIKVFFEEENPKKCAIDDFSG